MPIDTFHTFSYPFRIMEDEIESVLAEAPEFFALYRKLVIDADGHPGAAATFAELARYVTWLLDEAERSHISLTRCLDAVEKVVKTSENAEDLVVWSFFEGLGDRDAPRLNPWIGPKTRALVIAAYEISPL